MTSADVVIGAGFGDEGKGLITDFLAAPHAGQALVVRFNGGAQAGHTVVTPDGRRHPFSHVSSGSFAGAATFLSRFYACHPFGFVTEQEKLGARLSTPAIYVDGRSAVTTLYDIMLNQIAEQARGDGRHGSCGLGYGETIERQGHAPYQLFYADLADERRVRERLDAIRYEWLPKRMEALGLGAPRPEWQSRIDSPGIVQKFLDDAQAFLAVSQQVDEHFLRDTDRNIIFEGAQGLLLDQDHAWFPHVTRSHTGLRNVCALAKEAQIDALNVHYITRTYLTRHGAGPLPHELPHLPYPRITDETNIHNEYQGTLRFGWLDLDLLATTIHADLQKADAALAIHYGLAVSCMDQVDGDFVFIKDGAQQRTDAQGFIAALRAAVRPSFILASHGPSRSDVAPL